MNTSRFGGLPLPPRRSSSSSSSSVCKSSGRSGMFSAEAILTDSMVVFSSSRHSWQLDRCRGWCSERGSGSMGSASVRRSGSHSSWSAVSRSNTARRHRHRVSKAPGAHTHLLIALGDTETHFQNNIYHIKATFSLVKVNYIQSDVLVKYLC